VLNATGAITYAPTLGFVGVDIFTYRATDGLDSDPVSVVIRVGVGSNSAPVPSADEYDTTEDVKLAVSAPGVLGNDVDLDGDSIRVIVRPRDAKPAHGTLALKPDGSFEYTPGPGYSGDDTFTYHVSDGDASAGPVLVTIHIAPVADAPEAAADYYTVQSGSALDVAAPGVLRNDTDADGDLASAELVTDAAHGTLLLSPDGGLRYEPADDFVGRDRFTYRALDAGGRASREATVVIDVTASGSNRAPVAAPDVTETVTGHAVTLNVLANDFDPDGDPLVALLVTGPASGSVELAQDGLMTFTPGSAGTFAFTYRVFDGDLSDTATVTVVVRAGGLVAPHSAPDKAATREDEAISIDVLGNDSDADGDPLAVALESSPAHGVVATEADTGRVTYDPEPDWYGTDTFAYRAFDGRHYSELTAVTIVVSPVNDAPVARPDAASTTGGASVTFSVLANDTDAEHDELVAVRDSLPQHGSVSWSADGVLTYTADEAFVGTDEFTYHAWDGQASSRIAVVLIEVAAAKTPHVINARNDSASTLQDAQVRIDVIANDTDSFGHKLVPDIGEPPSNGGVTVEADGVTYVPNGDFVGTDTFTYRASDGDVYSDYAIVTVTVEASETAPSTEPTASAESSSTTATPGSSGTAGAGSGLLGTIGKALKGLVGGFLRLFGTQPARAAAMCLMPLAIVVLVAGMVVRRLREVGGAEAEE